MTPKLSNFFILLITATSLIPTSLAISTYEVLELLISIDSILRSFSSSSSEILHHLKIPSIFNIEEFKFIGVFNHFIRP
ncbi:MAG: hypothetical protein QXH46_03745 [Sulfolobales archaeon]